MESLSPTFVLTDVEQKEITQVLARLEALLTAEPRFLPYALSFINHKNRLLAREARARVCDCDERYSQPAKNEETGTFYFFRSVWSTAV